jgi:hypothetical protein
VSSIDIIIIRESSRFWRAKKSTHVSSNKGIILEDSGRMQEVKGGSDKANATGCVYCVLDLEG